MYVDELIASHTVNTMPEATLDAEADHGTIAGDTVRGNYEERAASWPPYAEAGIDFDDVFEVLETEGVDKFVVSWDELVETVRTSLEKASGGS